jgi:hypothetical protein
VGDPVTDTAIDVAQGVSALPDVDTVAINTIRALCMDAIQRADSGHPGTPMGVAPVAYTLWQRFCASIQAIRFGRRETTVPTGIFMIPTISLYEKPSTSA